MKRFVLLLFYFLPILLLAQEKKEPNEKDILQDKNYIDLQAELKPITESLNAISKEYQDATPTQKNDPAFRSEIGERYSAAMTKHNSALSSFVQEHPDSYISLLALNQLLSANADMNFITRLYKNLSESIKTTDFGKSLGQQIYMSSNTAIGSVAPDFTQNDPNGKPVKLSDFRGKYVLVDFWASWCGPCRKENPNVVNAYNQFKNKNFDILGVSLDNPNARSAWIKAIDTDHLTWTQVSDLQGWKNKVAVLYGVQSIPQNFLLDPKGVIVAKNLRGDDLVRTLSNILK